MRAADNGQPLAAGQDRWIVFVPGMAAINGWEDHPEAIPTSAFVNCRIKEVVQTQAGRPARHWLNVEVLDLAPFSSLHHRFQAHSAPGLTTWGLPRGRLIRHDGWELWYAPGDDAGYWYAAQPDADEAHIVAAGEWLYGPNPCAIAWAGHVVIAKTAWRLICEG